MELKWMMTLAFVTYTGVISAAPEVKTLQDGDTVDISCHVSNPGTLVLWFRVLDGSGMEYIAAVNSVNPKVVKQGPSFSSFSDTKISSNTLVLKRFNKDRDSGVYSCVSLPRASEMKVGKVTRLAPVKTAEKPTPPPTTKTATERPESRPTPPPCVCSTHTDPDDSMQCSLLILAPLAGGCGLLLLLLVCTVLYCNRIRTRRCPHHYKRKPHMAPGKQLMTNARI